MKTKTYSIHQAKTQLSKLIQKALHGEDIVISKRKKPLIRFSVIKTPNRKFDFFKGQIWMSKDFDKPLKDFKGYQ